MPGWQAGLSRRHALWGAALVLAGIDPTHAQSVAERTRKLAAWVAHIVKGPDVAPMSNGTLLDFPTEQVQRKQIGVTRAGVHRLFAVVIPIQRDGIVLAAGNSQTRSYGVHRTGTHLRRISSARNDQGTVSRWSGPACDADFQAQIAYWMAAPVG